MTTPEERPDDTEEQMVAMDGKRLPYQDLVSR